MVDLLPQFKKEGHDVSLLLFNGVETPFKKELLEKGIEIIELSREDDIAEKGSVYSPLNVLKLLKYMRQFDIIHTHNSICQLYVPIAKILTGSKAIIVTTEHNATNRRRSIKCYKLVDRWMYNRYNAIICIAKQTEENLVNYIGAKPSIRTIFNGIDTGKFLRDIKDIKGQTSYVITMISAFRKQKDHETLLRAMTALPDNYRLQFVGRGETEGHMKAICSQMGLGSRVTFLGMRSDVDLILENSDIVVLSSHWEGLSLSSIEGMASGRPFVASDVDGLHEMVSGAGVLFPHGDDKALANAIRELCENPDYYRQVAQACQERAKQYDISVMAEGYLELYESLMNDHHLS